MKAGLSVGFGMMVEESMTMVGGRCQNSQLDSQPLYQEQKNRSISLIKLKQRKGRASVWFSKEVKVSFAIENHGLHL